MMQPSNRSPACGGALLALGSVLSGTVGAAGEKEQFAALQGTWLVTKEVRNGESAPSRQPTEKRQLTFKGKTVEVMRDTKVIQKGQVRLHPGKPDWMDLTQPEKGTTLSALYKLERTKAGSQLTLCFIREGKPRPKRLTAERGSGQNLLVLQRK